MGGSGEGAGAACVALAEVAADAVASPAAPFCPSIFAGAEVQAARRAKGVKRQRAARVGVRGREESGSIRQEEAGQLCNTDRLPTKLQTL